MMGSWGTTDRHLIYYLKLYRACCTAAFDLLRLKTIFNWKFSFMRNILLSMNFTLLMSWENGEGSCLRYIACLSWLHHSCLVPKLLIMKIVDAIYVISLQNMPSEAMITFLFIFLSRKILGFLVYLDSKTLLVLQCINFLCGWNHNSQSSNKFLTFVFKNVFEFAQDHSAFFPVLKNVAFYLNKVIRVVLQWMGLKHFVQALKSLRRYMYQCFR